MSFAADLVCAAMVSGQTGAARDAAVYILQNSPLQSDPLAQIARKIVGSDPESDQENLLFDLSDTRILRANIHSLKRIGNVSMM